MTDVVSKEVRSRMMSNIRSVSKLEILVTKELWKKGARFRRNTKTLMGHPDISIHKYKVVIFIDSCFWHSCPLHQVIPKSNTSFWLEKFKTNSERDYKVNDFYLTNGWNLLRIWEPELRENFEMAVQRIYDYIIECKKGKGRSSE